MNPRGKHRTVYSTWKHLVARCTDEKHVQYPDYGGRGISVYGSWIYDFKSFYEYVGDRPSKLHSLDRIDNNGNYEPGNLRWVLRSIQSINTRKRRNTKSKYRGVSWDSSTNKWWVEITRNKVTYRLGRFTDEFEAHQAYEKWRVKLDGSDDNGSLSLGCPEGNVPIFSADKQTNE